MARYAIDASTLVRIVADDVRCSPDHQLVAPDVVMTDALSSTV